jgi:hypothetical protein
MKSQPSLRKYLLALAVPYLSFAAILSAANFPDPTIPAPFGVQLKSSNTSDENLDQIKDLGLKVIRRGFTWPNIEKSPGVYDFADYDRLVDAAQQRGLLILGTIALNNKKVAPEVYTDAGREAFVKFAAAVVGHYKGRSIIWEIWNEPNIATFWGKHGSGANSDGFADEYSDLVKAVVPAMRQADPDATIVAGSVNLYEASFPWMERCFKNGILKTGIDGWSVHPYSTKSPEGHLAYYDRIRKMFVADGAPADFPLLDTERGYPVGKAEGYAGGDPQLSKEYQSWHLVRQYLCDQLAGIKLTIWYQWSGKEGFELLSNNQAMPAMNACRTMIAQLAGYKLDKRLALDSDQDYALRYVDAAGEVKLVAWTSPPPGETPDKTVTHAVDLPVDAATTATVTQIYGDSAPGTISGGKLNVTLSGIPQYIALK